ncbi:MAG: hypothetical protein KDC87_10270 [Planctomycetes bacterium]|nr:hypothetical protein [Planctomycetota bacterium]MCB9870219.1 hypothetical protein [Planctomycetota bacterium]MCB9888201.1 hypothetical protein [Planctomycetota bacterium]
MGEAARSDPDRLVLGRHQSDNALARAPSLGFAIGAAAISSTASAGLVGWILHRSGVHQAITIAVSAVVMIGVAVLSFRLLTRVQRRLTTWCELGPESFEVEWAPRFGDSRRVSLPLRALGGIELHTSPPGVTLGWGFRGAKHDCEAFVSIPALAIEDEFERLVAHVERFAAGSLCSVAGEDDLRYLAAWTWADLFPWQHMVLRAKHDIELARGNCTLLTTGIHEFQVQREPDDSVSVLRAEGSDGGSPSAELQITGRWVVERRGVVLARLGTWDPFAIHMQLGSGESLELRRSDKSLTIDGRPVGAVITEWGQERLELREPVPEPLALLLLLLPRVSGA